MPGDGRGADVDGNAEGPIVEARPDRADGAAVVNRYGDAVGAGLECGLQCPNDFEIGGEAFEAPFHLERLEDAGEVAAGCLEGRPIDFHLVQAHDGIDDEVANRHAFADYLSMDLALRRHVDEDVAVDRGSTAEATIRRQAAQAIELGLICA